jgi:hypothetical protein
MSQHMTKEEIDLFVGVCQRRMDAWMANIAPTIQDIVIRDAPTFINRDDVRREVIERCLCQYARDIERAARETVERMFK